jgi:hypothetical protein
MMSQDMQFYLFIAYLVDVVGGTIANGDVLKDVLDE